MSRIGKKLVSLPATVKVSMEGPMMKVVGPKGTLTQSVHRDIKLSIEEGKVFVTLGKENATNKARAMWGLYRALLNNMVQGVEKGFEKKLEIEGVGFKAAIVGDEIVLNLGFVNPVKIKKPEGITFLVEKNVITVSG